MLEHKGAEPRFVWVHFYDPHDPYDPPEPYRTEYVGRLYDGEIAYADSALGHLLDFLAKQNLYSRAAIIVTGDHGEGLGEHGEQTHGIFLYDSTTHVPLIVKPPQGALTAQRPADRARLVDDQVRTIDIFPTILDVAGIEFDRPLDGASLKPLWTSIGAREPAGPEATAPRSRNSERAAFGETDYPLGFGWAPLRSVRLHEQKYIEAPRPEFYDLSADPAESQNVYAPWNGDVQKLRALVADMRRLATDPGGVAANVAPAKIEELRALGYLGKDSGSTTAPEPSLLPDPKDKIQSFNLIHSSMLAAEDRKAADARHDLESALALDPSSAVVLSQLGQLEFAQGNYGRATDLLSRALKIRPQDSAAALDEARARYASGDVSGSRDVLEGSESILTGSYEARVLLGKVNAGLKIWDKSEDALQAAIILDPARPEAYVELARAYLAQHKAAEALQQLELAGRLAPNSREVSDLITQAREIDGRSKR